MSSQSTDPRPDDPAGVMAHAGRCPGGKALIVLGGPSGGRWLDLYKQIQPDVLMGANGVNGMIPRLDYWMCAENMTRSNGLSKKGDRDSIRMMEMFHREAGAKVKLVSHRSWHLLQRNEDCVRIRRKGYELDEIPADFSFRQYGEGYMSGWLLKHKDAGAAVHVGTVGLHLLHHAGILGCSEVHTIGYDLLLRDEKRHHWYDHPLYLVDRFRNPSMFIEHRGLKTQWAWLEASQFLKEIEHLFERDGIVWKDHSDGLLKLEGLRCAV